jgi:N-acetylmuramoyl-L-alanine amidase
MKNDNKFLIALSAYMILVLAILYAFPTKAEVSSERLQYEIERGQMVHDAMILANVMVCEASVEGRVGMLAVANVVINRVNHPRFPNTIEEVVYQRHQFTCVTNGVEHDFSELGYRQAYQLAMDFLEGKTPRITTASHYYAPLGMPNGKSPSWAEPKYYLGSIGNHKFYRLYK